MIETVLLSVAGTLVTVLVTLGVAYAWGLRKLRAVRFALDSMHADSRAAAPGGVQRVHGAEIESVGSYGLADELEPAVEPARDKVALPVAQPKSRCSSCEHWNLDAGQKLMQAHPAFLMAAQYRAPWQMGQQTNPTYIELEKKILAGREAGEDVSAFEAEISKTPRTVDTPTGLKKNIAVTWSDFGACTHLGELRAKTDCCEHYVQASEA